MIRSFEKDLKQRLVKFANMLGVSDYSISLVVGKKKQGSADYDTFGYVSTDEETRSAAMFLNKRILKKDPNEIDNTIIHELLHVRLNRLLSLVDDILSKHIADKKARAVYTIQIEKLEHEIIIALVKALEKNADYSSSKRI
jgi:hypothetical protein